MPLCALIWIPTIIVKKILLVSCGLRYDLHIEEVEM